MICNTIVQNLTFAPNVCGGLYHQPMQHRNKSRVGFVLAAEVAEVAEKGGPMEAAKQWPDPPPFRRHMLMICNTIVQNLTFAPNVCGGLYRSPNIQARYKSRAGFIDLAEVAKQWPHGGCEAVAKSASISYAYANEFEDNRTKSHIHTKCVWWPTPIIEYASQL